MGLGRGEAPRWALAALAGVRAQPGPERLRWRRAEELAQGRAGREPTPTEVAAMRRALRGLAERGLVEVDRWAPFDVIGEFRPPMPPNGTRYDAWVRRRPGRRFLWARLPLTEAEREAEREAEEDRRR